MRASLEYFAAESFDIYQGLKTEQHAPRILTQSCLWMASLDFCFCSFSCSAEGLLIHFVCVFFFFF